ncbi:hypothetical protein DPMN_117611 [Dreissena polymorpha]|uniref:Uncharacterized protein n=1 Tax=Dreissena polymorpha TaxID=45954 RepID=A0A9D4GIN9_DREPO|nr:hypothetical protein DPMN_117611 [Dreissena polymorpha]
MYAYDCHGVLKCPLMNKQIGEEMATLDPSDAQLMLKKESLPAVRISNTADKFFKDLDEHLLSFTFPERELSDLQGAVYE